MAEYRIVRDNFAGFEVQARRWWWPFWLQVNFSNTHATIERAEQFAHEHAAGPVKYLGKLPDRSRALPAQSTEHNNG